MGLLWDAGNCLELKCNSPYEDLASHIVIVCSCSLGWDNIRNLMIVSLFPLQNTSILCQHTSSNGDLSVGF